MKSDGSFFQGGPLAGAGNRVDEAEDRVAQVPGVHQENFGAVYTTDKSDWLHNSHLAARVAALPFAIRLCCIWISELDPIVMATMEASLYVPMMQW